MRLRTLLADDRGSVMVEYLVLVGVVALLGLSAFTLFGQETSSVVQGEGADVAQMGF